MYRYTINDQVALFSQDDFEYIMDTIHSIWSEKDTITKEQVFEHLGELLEDLDVV